MTVETGLPVERHEAMMRSLRIANSKSRRDRQRTQLHTPFLNVVYVVTTGRSLTIDDSPKLAVSCRSNSPL